MGDLGVYYIGPYNKMRQEISGKNIVIYETNKNYAYITYYPPTHRGCSLPPCLFEYRNQVAQLPRQHMLMHHDSQ